MAIAAGMLSSHAHVGRPTRTVPTTPTASTAARPAASEVRPKSASNCPPACLRPQPSARSVVRSLRRARSNSQTHLPMSSSAASSSSSDRTMLCRSAPTATVVLVPLRYQVSPTRSGGRPCSPAGRSITRVDAVAATTASTRRPVACTISSATARIRSRLAAAPAGAATRILMTPIGAASSVPA